MAEAIVTKKYKVKDEDGVFRKQVYFGTQGNFVTVKIPGSSNYIDLQSYLEVLNAKMSNSISWERF